VEKNKSFFRRYLFDPFKYQVYFDTNEKEISHKIRDAIWPFFPENQHHLKVNDQEMISDYSEQKMKTNQELYGPLWIAFTLVIEFSIISHLIGAFKLQSVISSSENT
jgi:hypothetical protein